MAGYVNADEDVGLWEGRADLLELLHVFVLGASHLFFYMLVIMGMDSAMV